MNLNDPAVWIASGSVLIALAALLWLISKLKSSKSPNDPLMEDLDLGSRQEQYADTPRDNPVLNDSALLNYAEKE